MTQPNPYAPPSTKVEDVSPLEPSPSLWNPGAAASWSLLFTPICGSLVQMKNWQALGGDERAATSRNWAIGSGAFFTVMVLLIALAHSTVAGNLTQPLGFVLLITWYYANGKSQATYVTRKFGAQYRRGAGAILCSGPWVDLSATPSSWSRWSFSCPC